MERNQCRIQKNDLFTTLKTLFAIIGYRSTKFLASFSETTSQVFTTLKWLQWEWFRFEVSWWFSCQSLRFIDHKN